MNYLFKTIMCGAATLMLAGTSVAQTKPAFTEVDFSSIQSPNDNPFGKTMKMQKTVFCITINAL